MLCLEWKPLVLTGETWLFGRGNPPFWGASVLGEVPLFFGFVLERNHRFFGGNQSIVGGVVGVGKQTVPAFCLARLWGQGRKQLASYDFTARKKGLQSATLNFFGTET